MLFWSGVTGMRKVPKVGETYLPAEEGVVLAIWVGRDPSIHWEDSSFLGNLEQDTGNLNPISRNWTRQLFLTRTQSSLQGKVLYALQRGIYKEHRKKFNSDEQFVWITERNLLSSPEASLWLLCLKKFGIRVILYCWALHVASAMCSHLSFTAKIKHLFRLPEVIRFLDS